MAYRCCYFTYLLLLLCYRRLCAVSPVFVWLSHLRCVCACVCVFGSLEQMQSAGLLLCSVHVLVFFAILYDWFLFDGWLALLWCVILCRRLLESAKIPRILSYDFCTILYGISTCTTWFSTLSTTWCSCNVVFFHAVF